MTSPPPTLTPDFGVYTTQKLEGERGLRGPHHTSDGLGRAGLPDLDAKDSNISFLIIFLCV